MDTFKVTVDFGSGKRREFRLPKGEHSIGPASNCSIQIPAGANSGAVSHIVLNSDGFELLDRSEQASEEIEQTRTFQEFSDEIQLGELHLRIDRDESAVELDERLESIAPGASTIYEVGQQIAEGGMGNVIEARESALGRTVAMKVLHAKGEDSPIARRRFLREATVLARLEHPNIVPIHDFGRDADGKLFYTMKLVRGQTLGEVVRRLARGEADAISQFPLDRLLNDFRKVCDAIAFAHSRGVIHRDLKPDNIMLGEFGEVLVMDWGLAKILAEDDLETTEENESIEGFNEFTDAELHDLRASLTMAGAIVGTPQFMPPEQAEGRIKEIDARADVFALGGILYSLLTLRPPVVGKTAGEIFDRIRAGEIRTPTQYNQPGSEQLGHSSSQPILLHHLSGNRIPPALSAVAMRALSVSPDDRHQSTRELQRDVEAYQGGFATSAEQIGFLGQLLLLIKRHRIISSAAGLIVVLSIGFVIQLAKSRQEAVISAGVARAAEQTATAKEREARESLAISQITLAEAALRNADSAGIVRALENTPSENRDHNWNYLWTRHDDAIHAFVRTNPDTVPLLHPTHPDQWFAHNPNGTIELRKDEERIKSYESSITGPAIMAVSDDGQRLAIATLIPRTCEVFEIESGNRLAVCDLLRTDKRSRIAALRFSPAGESLFVGLDRHAGVFLFDAESGALRWRKDLDHHAAFHPGRPWLAIQDADEVSLLNLSDGSVASAFDSGAVHSRSRLSISPDGVWLASSDRQETIRVHNLRTGGIDFRFQPHDWVRDLAFTRDNRLVVLGNDGKAMSERAVLSIWDIAARRRIQSLLGVPKEASGFAFHAATGQLLVSDRTQSKRWQITTGAEIKSLRSTVPDPQGLAFLDERRLICPYDRSLLALVDFQVNTVTQLPGRGFGRLALNADHNNLILASVFDRGAQLAISRCQLGANLNPILTTNTFAGLTDLRFAQGGNLLAAAYRNHSPRVLDATTLAPVDSLETKDLDVRQIAFAHDDLHLVTIAQTNNQSGDELILWRRSDGVELDRRTFARRINALSVSPDGARIAVGGEDKTIRFFAAQKLKLVKSFRAHDEAIISLAFHPTEPWLATASDDLTIKLWHCETGRLVWQTLGPSQSPTQLVFSPSGRHLATTEKGGRTRVWKLPEQPQAGVAGTKAMGTEQ